MQSRRIRFPSVRSTLSLMNAGGKRGLALGFFDRHKNKNATRSEASLEDMPRPKNMDDKDGRSLASRRRGTLFCSIKKKRLGLFGVGGQG